MRRLILLNCAFLLLWCAIGFELGRETAPSACDQASVLPSGVVQR